MIKEYLQKPIIPQKSWQVLDPFYYVRIDSLARDDTLLEEITGWERNTNEWGYRDSYYGKFWGLDDHSKLKYITFSKEIELPDYDLFLCELTILKDSKVPSSSTGDLTFTITQKKEDNTVVKVMDENSSMHNPYGNMYDTVIRMPIVKLDPSLDTTFAVAIPKWGFILSVKIIPINRFEGSTNLTIPTDNRLDIKNISFSRNGVNEVDKGQIKIGFKDEYYDETNPYSTLYFDAFDHVTISVGDSMRSVTPIFGGYVSGWSLDDDLSELTIDIVDRLYDYTRVSVLKNYGVGPVEDANKEKAYLQLHTVEDTIHYLSSTTYPMKLNVANEDFLLVNSFGDQTSINGLIGYGWNVEWISEVGNPPPCAKLTIQTITNLNKIIIFTSNDYAWDAAKTDYFHFDYLLPNKKTLPSFYIAIDMQKSKESTVQTYYINFTGNVPTQLEKRVLTGINPNSTGTWESFTLDLKTLFNKSKTGASKTYYIRGIRFVATANNPTDATIYIDNIRAFSYKNALVRFNRTELKKVLEELQEVCKLSNYVAYTSPAMERRDDQLVVRPAGRINPGIRIIENENLLNVSSVEYKPLDWGLCNYAERTYVIEQKVPIKKKAQSQKNKAKKQKKKVKTATKKEKKKKRIIKLLSMIEK